MHLRFSTQALQIKDTYFSARQFIIEHFFKREGERERKKEGGRERTVVVVRVQPVRTMAGLYFKPVTQLFRGLLVELCIETDIPIYIGPKGQYRSADIYRSAGWLKFRYFRYLTLTPNPSFYETRREKICFLKNKRL